MNIVSPASIRPPLWFQSFKYAVFLLLGIDILMFLQEEWRAAEHTLAGAPGAGEVLEAFAQTIDTAAWVGLLLLFELETSVIPYDKIQGRLQWLLHGVRAVCYCIIVFAFAAYALQCLNAYQISAVRLSDLCALAGTGASFLIDQNEFLGITAANCATLPFSDPMFEFDDMSVQVLTDSDTLLAVQRLAWTDVINAGDWLLVVLLLEIDVRLQERGGLEGKVLLGSKAAKTLLYLILLACAVYWGFAGDFLDFWDAFLWLLAFVLIELNVFEWHETATRKKRGRGNNGDGVDNF